MSAKHTLPYSHLLLEAPGQDGDIFPICTHKNDGKRRTIAHSFSRDHARRIVAAVNAVAGIRTEVLEAGVVGEMMVEAKKIGMHARLDDLHPKDFQRLRAIVLKAKGESP